MGIQSFFCHNNWQDFKKYEHKTLGRVFYFGQCEKCGKYFYLEDGNKLIEGKDAKEWYKYFRPNLKVIEPEYVITFLKSLCFATPVREVLGTIYATDENGKTIIKKIYEDVLKKNRKGKVILDKDKKPIVERKLVRCEKIVESRIFKEYQDLKIDNKGVTQTITNSMELGIKPNIFEEIYWLGD